MVDIFFMRGTQIIVITRNTSVIPRMGDFIEVDRIKVAVKEVIWHLDHETWVEVQI